MRVPCFSFDVKGDLKKPDPAPNFVFQKTTLPKLPKTIVQKRDLVGQRISRMTQGKRQEFRVGDSGEPLVDLLGYETLPGLGTEATPSKLAFF